MPDSIAVVIPYFQRKAGILLKAVSSIIAQQTDVKFHVIIVDDASPVPAKDEMRDLMVAYPDMINIVEQANAGPAAARNRGLEQVPAGTEYVAFLDSDDTWTPEHIANAVAALDAGYDFYFSDLYQLNQNVSAFNRAKRIDVSKHPLIGAHPDLRVYTGDMFDQILTGNIIGTPTVVYRFSKFSMLRFREGFVYAGEDYLFWLEISQLTDKIAFSALSECVCGEGVNIFAGSGWGTEKSLIRLHYEMKFKKALPRLFALNDAQRASNNEAVRRLRQSFVADWLHRLLHRKSLEWHVLREQVKVDPQSFLFFLPLVARMAMRRQ